MGKENVAMRPMMSILKRIYEIMASVVDADIILEQTSRDRTIGSGSYPLSDMDLSGGHK